MQSKSKISDMLSIYQRWLPTQVISQLLSETGRTYYKRVLPPVLVLWGFIFQRLNSDHTCDAAWSHLTSDHVRQQLGVAPLVAERVSESTSAYCQARKRLPQRVAQAILPLTAQALQEELGSVGEWHGYPVNVFDGSTIRLQASQELTEHYGLSKNQHGTNHWPLLRLVAGFDLYSGAVHDVTEGPYLTSEHALGVQLIRQLGPDYLHVADRNFGVYHLLQAIVGVGSQALVRLKITQAKRLAPQGLRPGLDVDVLWSPSRFDLCEPDLPTPPIAGRLIYVRLEKDGFRPLDLYFFTTLTDRAEFPPAEIVDLYGARWTAETNLRHVKTTLQMEELSAKSVEMVRKELLLGLVAYNLLRGLMAMAAVRAGRAPQELSLAQCWRRVTDAGRNLPANASPAEIATALDKLLIRLGRCVIPKRKKQRFEPRAVWGRPRVYPTIKGSRDNARQQWMELLKSES
jgi:hypothetical protein